MEMRRLGAQGPDVSVLSFGTMTFGGRGMSNGIGSTSGSEADRLISLCLEAGVNLFDTADIYSYGDSETILGEVIAGRRSKVLLATKTFGQMATDGDVGCSRQRIIRACENSLRRLKTEYIDLYQLHNFDSLVPIYETIQALHELQESGKIRFAGCSNYFAWQLSRALRASASLGTEPFVSQQIQYSLAKRDVEIEILPFALDSEVGTLAWSPLAAGLLTGKYMLDRGADGRLAALGRVDALSTPESKEILEAVQTIAKARNVSPSQVALNWVRAMSGISSVILGAKNEDQLRDNLSAATWMLDDREIAWLSACSRRDRGYPHDLQASFHPERNLPRIEAG